MLFNRKKDEQQLTMPNMQPVAQPTMQPQQPQNSVFRERGMQLIQQGANPAKVIKYVEAMEKMQPDGGIVQPTNISAAGEIKVDSTKLSKSQAESLGYGKRMLDSGKIINSLGSGVAQKGLVGSIKQFIDEKQVGTTLGNRYVPKEFQQYDQARRNFINAILRRESGAAISEGEFDNAEKQYFPVPGDTPEVLSQKQANREMATKNFLGEAGVTSDIGGQQPQQDDQPSFQGLQQWIQANPNDPKAAKAAQMIQSGQLTPDNFGNLLGGQPQPQAQPVEQPQLQQAEQPKKKDLTSNGNNPLSLAQDVLEGASSGVLSTEKGIVELLQKGGDSIRNKIIDVLFKGDEEMKKRVQEKSNNMKNAVTMDDKSLEATNTAQKIGKGAEQLAEFFVPSGAAVKGAKYAEKALQNAPKVAKTVGNLAARAGIGAAEFGGVTAAQTGGDKEEVKSAMKMGAAFPVGGAVVGGVFRGAKNVFVRGSGKTVEELRAITSATGPLRNVVEKARTRGVDVIDKLAKTNLLKGTVGKDGIIRTIGEGGAFEQYNKNLIEPLNDKIFKHLEKTKQAVPIDVLLGDFKKTLTSQGLSGQLLKKAGNKMATELDALVQQFPHGKIPLKNLQKMKTDLAGIVSYDNPKSKALDKLLIRAIKETIEKNGKGINVKGINKVLSERYEVQKFIKKLDGARVQNGKLGKYMSTGGGAMIGTIAGSSTAGVPGAIVGGLIGKVMGKKIRERAFKKTFSKAVKKVKPTKKVNKADNQLRAIKNFMTGKKLNKESLKKKVLSKNKSAAGVLAGVEKDDDGKVKINPTTAMLGVVGATIAGRAKPTKFNPKKLAKIVGEKDRKILVDYIDKARIGKTTTNLKKSFAEHDRAMVLADSFGISKKLSNDKIADKFEEVLNSNRALNKKIGEKIAKSQPKVEKSLAERKLIDEAKKHKTADEFIEGQTNKVHIKLKSADEAIGSVQKARHELHSLNTEDIYRMDSEANGMFDKNIEEIITNIKRNNITGTEKNIVAKIKKAQKLENRKADVDLEWGVDMAENEYKDLAVREISKEKETINKIVEDYLSELDIVVKKNGLNTESLPAYERNGQYAPTGYARMRAGGAESAFVRKEIGGDYSKTKSQLKEIWEASQK